MVLDGRMQSPMAMVSPADAVEALSQGYLGNQAGGKNQIVIGNDFFLAVRVL